jgi:hypothetical protein
MYLRRYLRGRGKKVCVIKNSKIIYRILDPEKCLD